MTLPASRPVETEPAETAARHAGYRGQSLRRTSSHVSRRHLSFVTRWQLVETAVADLTVASDQDLMGDAR